MLSILLMENHESESFLAVQRRKTIPTVINFSYLTTCKFDFLAPIYLTQALFMLIVYVMLQIFGSHSIFPNPISHGCSKSCFIYVMKTIRQNAMMSSFRAMSEAGIPTVQVL